MRRGSRVPGALSRGLSGFLALAAADGFGATEPTKDQVDFFESRIRPILSENCYGCHSVEQGKSKGGLTLDTRDGWMTGGDDGPVIAPGDPTHSVLIKAVGYTDKDLQMPPKNKKLSDEAIAALTEWVKLGAPDPRTATPGGASKLTGLTDAARQHWAYQPLKAAAPPEVKNSAWCATAVDRFVMAKLEENSMVPAPPATREALIRRVYYDLIGLPPSPEQVEAFIGDSSPGAYAKVVDQLLASPRYGERWARHWLDTARYSDTTGAEKAGKGALQYRYSDAWTYRDYVIDSLNQDKPYNEFILEQLAADQLPSTQQDKTRLAALGFLTVGKRFPNANDVINDRIDVTSKAFLGTTVSCARCHDHKFDPIPTTDYYALHGVFASTVEPEEKPIIRMPDATQYAEFQQKLAGLEATDRAVYYDFLGETLQQFHAKAGGYLEFALHYQRKGASAEAIKAQNDLAASQNLDMKLAGSLAKALKNDPVFRPLRAFSELPEEGFAQAAAERLARMKENSQGGFPQGLPLNSIVVAALEASPPASMKETLAIYAKLLAAYEPERKAYLEACANATAGPVTTFNPALVDLIQAPFRAMPASEITTAKLTDFAGSLQKVGKRTPWVFDKISELELTDPGAPARAMAVADSPTPKNSPVFIRGQAQVKGEVVPRHTLEILSPNGKPEPFKIGSGRLELAESIASPTNPLTARVMVNRVWMHHFGEGFVPTPDDLGTRSEPPSHPELLDYLARYFMENGWSLKKLHRLIVLSNVYQESTETMPACEKADPRNRLLWHANIRRLDFESLRDTLLVFSGKLEGPIGGQPVNLTDEPYSGRRSIYGYIDRGNLPELLSVFDFPDPDMPNSRRDSTVVPQQALFMMNSPMAVDAARSIDARPPVLRAWNDTMRICQLYRIIFQRAPWPQEIRMGLQFVAVEQSFQGKIDAGEKGTPPAPAASGKGGGGKKDYGRSPIHNPGTGVERKPLTPWEAYTQALLFSNEASYVN